MYKRFDCLFLRLIFCFCVWFFIFVFDCLFLRLIIYFCVSLFTFAFGCMFLRWYKYTKKHTANRVNSWCPIFSARLNSKIKSSLNSRYYAEACNEWQDYLPCLAPGQHSFEETSQRWRAVGDTASDLTHVFGSARSVMSCRSTKKPLCLGRIFTFYWNKPKPTA